MIERLWPNEQRSQSPSDGQPADPAKLYEAIQRLSPQNEMQRSIKAQALAIVTDVAQTRWLMFEQKSLSISKPLLVILVFWLTINFFSFGLFAPRNATVIVTLCLCALAVAGAIFPDPGTLPAFWRNDSNPEHYLTQRPGANRSVGLRRMGQTWRSFRPDRQGCFELRGQRLSLKPIVNAACIENRADHSGSSLFCACA